MVEIALFILISIIIANTNKNKLYLLFIPLMLIYKRCIFIPFEFEIFGMNLYMDLVVFSIVIVSFIINSGNYYKNLFKINSLESLIIIVFIIYLFFILIMSAITGGIFKAITLSRYLLYIPLLYNAYLRIFQGVNKHDFEKFVDKVIILNTVFAIFYILDSSGIFTIYTGVKYFTEVTQFGIITRNYDTFPPLTIFVIIFLLTKTLKKKISISYIAILLIHFLAVFFTYTRSMMISLGIIIAIYLFLTLISNAKKSKVVIIMSFTGVILLGAYSLVSDYFSGPMLFLIERFQPQNSTLLTDNNLVTRFSLFNVAYNVAAQYNNVWLGAGFLQAARNAMENYWAAWAGDIMWTNFVLQSGLIGSIIFLLFILSFIFKLLLKTKELSNITIGLLLIVSYYLIMSFTTEGFMGYFYLPVMYLAIAEVEINNLWFIKNKILPNYSKP